jgi:hypothetical protein
MTTLKFITSNLLQKQGLLEGLKSIRNDSGTARRFGRSSGILMRINSYELFVNSSFNEEELTVVWQSINVEHACHYCVPAHRYRCNDESRRSDY